MADRTIFILGASRGIGLGLVKEFLARGWQVVASERSRSDALHALEQTQKTGRNASARLAAYLLLDAAL